MGASGKWVKALIGFNKKPDKDEHVIHLLITCTCMPQSTITISHSTIYIFELWTLLYFSMYECIGEEQEVEAMEEFFRGHGFLEGLQRKPK